MNEIMKKDLKMTSIDVAEITGKNHADVIRDIRSEIESLKKKKGLKVKAFLLCPLKSINSYTNS